MSKSNMPPLVILAGGLGTRMQELTRLVPKPMVEIGAFPILWHIMKIYTAYGVTEFFLALGYRGEVIKEYFSNYEQRVNTIRVNLSDSTVELLGKMHEDWTINLIDTGESTQTGGRISRLKDVVGDRPFFLTYGDAVADVDIKALLAHHADHGRIGTVTAVRPPSKYGALDISGRNQVRSFTEKPMSGDTWINGGFFVFQPEIFNYVTDDETCIFEREPLEKLSKDGQLSAYLHRGFWQCMDTAKDVELVSGHWKSGKAPWKIWD